jgi:hypothetical protein
MPVLIEAEADNIYQEGRSLLASIVTQLVSIVRQILTFLMNLSVRFVEWAGEHPLAAITSVINMAIWIS